MGTRHYHFHDSSESAMQADRNKHQETMVRLRQQHEAAMKELAMKDKSQKREALQQLKADIEAKVTSLKQEIAQNHESLKTAAKGEEVEAVKVQTLSEQKEKWPEKEKEELGDVHNAMKEAGKKFADCQAQIESIRKQTGQSGHGVVKFLLQCQELIGATCANQVASSAIEQKIKEAATLLQRLCDTKVSVDEYARDQMAALQKLVPALQRKGIEFCSDMTCNDEDEFKSLVNMIEAEHYKDEKVDVDEESSDEADPEELAQKYLKKWKLEQYAEGLFEEGWDDPSVWNELTEEELIEMGWKRSKAKQFQKKVADLANKDAKKNAAAEAIPSCSWSRFEVFELNKLRGLCIGQEWKKNEADKYYQHKKNLMVAAPVLTQFFLKIDVAVKTAQKMIELPTSSGGKQELNETQLKAIKAAERSADDQADDEDKKEEKDVQLDEDAKQEDESLRKSWTEQSQCKVYSESEEKWFDGTIQNIKEDDKGEWLMVAYKIHAHLEENSKEIWRTKEIGRFSSLIRPKKPSSKLAQQSMALTKSAVIAFHVVDEMCKQPDYSDSVALSTVGGGIEGGCIDIFKSQGKIRQSVVLAQNILSLRPADAKGSELWGAVDNGIVRIYESALMLAKTSVEYFSYFIRFRSSFGFFMSCYEGDSAERNMSLAVSTEHLQQDIRDFLAFQKSYSSKIESLEGGAMGVISGCIKNLIGAKNAEEQQKIKVDLKTARDTAREAYYAKKTKIDTEYNQLCSELGEAQGKVGQYRWELDNLPKYNETNTALLTELNKDLAKIAAEYAKI